MPNTLSAKKRVRQNERARARSRWRKREIHIQVKSFMAAVQTHDVAKAEEEYRKTVAILDKVAGTSTIHKNTAARRKSRLARRLNDLKKSS